VRSFRLAIKIKKMSAKHENRIVGKMKIYCTSFARKNDFTKVSKNLVGYIDLKIILLNHQNNDVERLNIFDDVTKCFNILATSLNVLYNHFDGPNKIIFRSVSS